MLIWVFEPATAGSTFYLALGFKRCGIVRVKLLDFR